jgi:hypothetical protein
VKYDDASWHYGGDFPKDLPREAGATHIGMFLAWAILRDLPSNLHRDEIPEALERVRRRATTGAEFLRQECDEKFTDEDLNDLGNSFAQAYYEKTYLADYCRLFAEAGDAYRVDDTWANFDRLAPVLDARFREWRERQARGGTKWWHFWR